MYFGRLLSLCFLFWSVRNLVAQKNEELVLLQDTVNALYKGLQYMENQIDEINLDGAFGCRLVQVLLDTFVDRNSFVFEKLGRYFEGYLKRLSAKAGKIADVAKSYVRKQRPDYYATVGALLEKMKTCMWYPSRETNSFLIEKPVPCSKSGFNETFNDACLHLINVQRDEEKKTCGISDMCLKFQSRPQQRGYVLTHQVLFFELMEMENCVHSFHAEGIPKALQDRLCSNVMRDAEEIAASGFPLNHRDLFMEQIGLCGLWGYRDFYKPSWLMEILEWQQASGCYANRAKWYCTENMMEQSLKIKRSEKILEDGCLSHKTTVALVAIAANVRFIAEKVSKMI